MSQIKLIAVDLDGTLLRSDKTIAPESAKALREAVERGVCVVLTTARRLPSVREFSARIGISQPVICSDGAVILSAPNGDIWQKEIIPLDAAQEITTLADKHGWELAIVVDDTTYLKQRSGQPLGAMGTDKVIVASCSEMLPAAPIRILAYETDAIKQLKTWSEIAQQKYRIRYETFRNPMGHVRSCGIFPKVDKGQALTFVAHRLQIPLESVLVIGDELNDLAMFTVAGISVSMGNALDDIKQAADYVAPSNDDEGVAWTVKQFVLDDNESNL